MGKSFAWDIREDAPQDRLGKRRHEMSLNPRQHSRAGQVSGPGVHRLAILNDHQHRDAVHPKETRKLGLLIHVDESDLCPALELRTKAFHFRFERQARRTPRRPKVHEDRMCRLKDIPGKCPGGGMKGSRVGVTDHFEFPRERCSRPSAPQRESAATRTLSNGRRNSFPTNSGGRLLRPCSMACARSTRPSGTFRLPPRTATRFR